MRNLAEALIFWAIVAGCITAPFWIGSTGDWGINYEEIDNANR